MLPFDPTGKGSIAKSIGTNVSNELSGSGTCNMYVHEWIPIHVSRRQPSALIAMHISTYMCNSNVPIMVHVHVRGSPSALSRKRRDLQYLECISCRRHWLMESQTALDGVFSIAKGTFHGYPYSCNTLGKAIPSCDALVCVPAIYMCTVVSWVSAHGYMYTCTNVYTWNSRAKNLGCLHGEAAVYTCTCTCTCTHKP